MRLQPVPLASGLWQTPDYEPQKAAVHALIVGISSYPRLETGQNIGFQQLAVSALTAYRFFRWLGTSYRHSAGVDHPIQARLLLSPTPAESALFEGDGLAIKVGDQVGCTARDPHLFNFRNAVKDWFNAAAAVRENVAESRTIFFFSGHGLEIDRDKQLLLPSDYRYTEADRMDLLSTENIKGGMARLAISKQFYFVDACRSDVASMWDLADASGMSAVPDSKIKNKALVASVMRASVADAVTYQPSSATSIDSLSFFGKALMDALELNPGADLLFQPATLPEFPAPAICWYPLYSYVNRAVKGTIAQYPHLRAPLTGPVSIGEMNEDPLLLTLVEGPAPAPPPPPPQVAPPRPPGLRVGGVGESAPLPQGALGFGIIQPQQPIAQGVAQDAMLQVVWTNDGPLPPTVYDFGNPAAYALVTGAQSMVWSNDGWMQSSHYATPFDIVAVERSPDGGLVRLHVTMTDRGWNWLEFRETTRTSSNQDSVSYAFLIPEETFESRRMIVAIDIAAGSSQGLNSISDVQATLSTLNTGSLGVAAKLFQLYRAQTAGRALSQVASDPNFIPDDIARTSTFLLGPQDMAAAAGALQGKTDSPIAATVAALVLLRARRFDENGPATHWLGNLSEWYPYSDASVFAHQALVDNGADVDIRTALSFFTRIAQCGTPFTSEGFGYLLRMFDTYFRPDARGRSPLLSSTMKDGLPQQWQAFHRRIVDVQGAYRGSSLFTTFVAPRSKIVSIQNVIA